MSHFRSIVSPVGAGLTSHSHDVKIIRKNLSDINIDAGKSEHVYIDYALDKAIKYFQRNENLKIDGLIFPRGETEERLLLRIDQNREKMPSVPVPDVESEPLGQPKIKERTIPGTNIPDRGIPEQGYPNSPIYNPFDYPYIEDTDLEIEIKPPKVDRNMPVLKDDIPPRGKVNI